MRKLFGFLAVAGLLAIAAPAQRAEAAVAAPGSASLLQTAPAAATTEVQYRRRGYGPRRYFAPRRFYGPRRYFAPRVYAPRYSRRDRY